MKVVIASKGALVLYWDQIVQHSKSIRFSGAVGAPLPIFELRDRMLVGSTVTGFEGILNATTNVILEAMDNGHTYEQGVKIAQDQGCAETDPTLDVDGWDASAKAVILANSLLGANLKLSDVDRSSMRGITVEQIQNAKQNGKKLKYIAGARKEGDQVKAWARAEQRDLSDALGGLSGGDMGVILKTDNLGSVAATNRELGDGGTLTALTCLRDVINLLKDTR
jgi:homoserine dehydrogenase